MAESLKAQEPIAVANFVIDIANKNKLTVTNLQLQKILFFLQGFSLDNYHVSLINGSFSKWQYGPVQKDVYRIFRDNGASPIINEYVNAYFDEKGQFQTQTPKMENISNDEKKALKAFTLKLLKIPAWKLVGLTHHDPSWYNYKNKIMNYEAPDYKNEEILSCFNNSKLELG